MSDAESELDLAGIPVRCVSEKVTALTHRTVGRNWKGDLRRGRMDPSQGGVTFLRRRAPLCGKADGLLRPAEGAQTERSAQQQQAQKTDERQ
jgi:hypothetical protein